MFLDSSRSPRLGLTVMSTFIYDFATEQKPDFIERRYNIFLDPNGRKIEILTFSNSSEDVFDGWFEEIDP